MTNLCSRLQVLLPNTKLTRQIMGSWAVPVSGYRSSYGKYLLAKRRLFNEAGILFPHAACLMWQVACALVHLFVVAVSASQADGTAPLAEFNDVFNPAGNPQVCFDIFLNARKLARRLGLSLEKRHFI